MSVAEVDVNDPASWDPALDAAVAAPENHKVLYEDDNIRVLLVSIAPGVIEKPHHHRWPSVFVIDRMVKKARDFDGDGNQIPLPVPTEFEPPLIARMPPQPIHYVANDDSHAFHGTRIEFKRGYAGDGR
jgi:predicted metal-dependent enzyme (double-stranded beta helix superfamily)